MVIICSYHAGLLVVGSVFAIMGVLGFTSTSSTKEEDQHIRGFFLAFIYAGLLTLGVMVLLVPHEVISGQ